MYKKVYKKIPKKKKKKFIGNEPHFQDNKIIVLKRNSFSRLGFELTSTKNGVFRTITRNDLVLKQNIPFLFFFFSFF